VTLPAFRNWMLFGLLLHEIAANSDDANVAMRMMRHRSLATTTKYMRSVEARMRQAVEFLRGDSKGRKRSQNVGSGQLGKFECVRENTNKPGIFQRKSWWRW
jgi:hypothetical protein